jgi:integrase
MATIYTKRSKLHIDYTGSDGKRKTVNLKINNNSTNRRKAGKIKEEIEATIENKYIKNNADTVSTPQIKNNKSTGLSLFEAIKKYFDGHIVLTSQKNQISYRVAMSYLIEAVNGNTDIKDIEPEHIIIITTKLKVRVANATLHTYLRYIKSLFNYLIEEDLIEKSPVKKKNIPRREKKKVVPFSKKMHIEILEEAKLRDIEFYKALMMFGLIGGRPCDMLRLKDTDFDFEKDILKFKMSKTGREILFPIYRELKTFINSDMPEIFKAEGKLIFKGLTVNAVSQRFRRLKKDLGIHERYMYTLKTFRKTFATINSGKGMNLQELADLLGHEDMATTKTYYTHVDVEKLKEKMDSL